MSYLVLFNRQPVVEFFENNEKKDLAKQFSFAAAMDLHDLSNIPHVITISCEGKIIFTIKR